MKEKINKPKGTLISRIFKEKCPNCGVGEVFEKKKKVFQLPVMKEECDHCHYHFDREPGYFLGAMYISYGLAVFQGIFTFVLLTVFFPGITTLGVVLIILTVICLFSLKNYKLSRIIYMHIFPD
jgi:uncharacterized protein (DUF983 family)